MESGYELAAVTADGSRPHLVLVQEINTVRCPTCKGLRAISVRHVTRNGKVCQDCRAGNVVPKSWFHNYWLERYTMEEIEEMAGAIWG